MFRQLRRIKQQLSQEDCISVLKNEVRGVLSVLGDDDYPYGVPINFYYSQENNKIYFHGSREGHKIDAIKNHDKVSFCVYDKGTQIEGKRGLEVSAQVRVKEFYKKLGYKEVGEIYFDEYCEHITMEKEL